MIGIVDYGSGNLASVQHSLTRIGTESEIFDKPNKIENYDRLILPGVGSFRLAMNVLKNLGWNQTLKHYVQSGRPLLGICLGMQLLFERGFESGKTTGLGLIGGEVILLHPLSSLKVPHIGWNSLSYKKSHPLLKGIKPHVDYYFIHSYHCVVSEKNDVIARCKYGIEFDAIIARDNIVGVQFHPEKSQPNGLTILENFSKWNGKC